MTEKLDFYRCKVCGNTVQVIIDGFGELVCCQQPMELLKPNKQENVTTEYHIPVYKQDENNNMFIQVGQELHPMTEEHHIEFIETVSGDKKVIKLRYLLPPEEAKISVCKVDEGEKAIELCNIHGLWEGKSNE